MAMTDRIMKAVIPAAGLGNALPARDEGDAEGDAAGGRQAGDPVRRRGAVDAGLTDVLMITGRNKNALENYFDRVAELEYTLEAKGDTAKLRAGQRVHRPAQMHYVRQGDPKGLGHAMQRAEMHVNDEPFAVLLGDDLIDARDVLLRACSTSRRSAMPPSWRCRGRPRQHPPVRRRRGGTDRRPRRGPDHRHGREAGEGRSPANYAVIGRYVLKPEVFAVLDRTEPGKGGEIQLTDALMEMATDVEGTGGVYGVVFRGRRYDTGDKLDYIKAVIQLAADRDDLGPELRPWLAEYAAGLERG